jgi:hypothetical protein
MVWRSSTRRRSGRKADKLPRLRCGRPRWSLVLVGSALAVIGLAQLSSVPGPGYSAQTGWLVLSWTYVSVPVEYDTLQDTAAAHASTGRSGAASLAGAGVGELPLGRYAVETGFTPRVASRRCWRGGVCRDPRDGQVPRRACRCRSTSSSELLQVERGSAVVVELREGRFLFGSGRVAAAGYFRPAVWQYRVAQCGGHSWGWWRSG